MDTYAQSIVLLGDCWPLLLGITLIALIWPLSAGTPSAHQRIVALLIVWGVWVLLGVLGASTMPASPPAGVEVSTGHRTVFFGLTLNAPESREMLLVRFLGLGAVALSLLTRLYRYPGRLPALRPVEPGEGSADHSPLADRRFGPKVNVAQKPTSVAADPSAPRYRTDWHPRSTWVVLGYAAAVFIPMLLLMSSSLTIIFPNGPGNQTSVAGLPIDRAPLQVQLFGGYMVWFIGSLAICARYFTMPSPTNYRLVIINGVLVTLGLLVTAVVLKGAERPANPLAYLMLTLVLALLHLILIALPPTAQPHGHRRRPELTVHDLDS